MEKYIRPAPPFEYTDSGFNSVISKTNANQIVAGKGISIRYTPAGTVVGLKNSGSPNRLNYTGPYNYSSSYAVNDVVYVDPTQTYYDQNGVAIPWTTPSGSTAPGLTAGLFVCINPISPVGFDDALLTGSIAPAIEAAGQTITSDIADTYRHYDLNYYYPFWPLPAGWVASWVAEETWTTVTSQSYWAPLAPATTTSTPSASLVYQVQCISEGLNCLICSSSYGAAMVMALTLTNSGSAYTSAPTLSITGTSGSGATGHAVLSGSYVSAVILDTGGSGYENVTCSFSGGGGSGAAATGTIGTGFTVAKPPPLRGFVNSTNDAQGTLQSIQPPYPSTSSLAYLYIEEPTGGTNVSGVTWIDQNISWRGLFTLLPTCETILGVTESKSRYFACTTYF